MIELLFLAAAAKAAVPTVNGTYDCQADVPMIIAQKDGKTEVQRMGGIEAGKMAFTLALKGTKANVFWPGSPINVGGKGEAIATAPDAGMALFTSVGPCTFTNQGCATMINYSRQSDGTLRLLLQPTALITDAAKKTRTPFLVIIQGNCKARADNK